MSRSDWTDVERFEAVRMRQRGHSVQKIAEHLGITPEFLRAGLPYAQRKYNSRHVDTDPRRPAQQITPQEAADGLTRAIRDNVTDQYVKRRLKELFGIELSLAEVDAGRERMRLDGVSLQYAFGIEGKAA